MKQYVVAILGARSAVGQCMYDIVKQRKFPVKELRLISPSGAKGEMHGLPLLSLTEDVFKGVDVVLSSPGADISKIWSPVAAKNGAVVIDNTSQFRMDKDVPLVVPEVNPEDVKWHKGIIANPNCSTIQMVVALKPLHDYAKIKRIVVSTYQAISGAGSEAIDEMKNQLKGDMKPRKLAYQILHNLIPQIDVFMENHYTKEEIKMVNETKKIMHDEGIKVTATCIRVPVFNAHSESVNIETEKKLTRAKVIELLTGAPGVIVVDEPANKKYPMPIDADGKDETFVGRIREDETIPNGINLWVVSDNLRKGAALNAVQIAEKLVEYKMI
ncbi:MAG: aspartate-semialdehyde dehydrogenase [Candidatus Omnitrophica bacterium]|nr:aspartate-semialdehyde dehydrogenase [Candidatus Omnitrophota bacterium]